MTSSTLCSGFLFLGLMAGRCEAAESSRTFQAPVERNRFMMLTSYDSLQAFLGEISRDSGVTLDVIGRSKEGRSITAVGIEGTGSPVPAGRLRVLLFAQQHGDEPSGKEALTMLLGRCASRRGPALFEQLDLRIIPQMNPDGSERRQRRTSEGIDLNRSHLLLNSPETIALHELFASWKPQVTLDVHEYGAYSESWMEGGFIKGGTVQLGMLTNLNSSNALRTYQHAAIYPFIASKMAEAGFAFHEYIVGSPKERIRHSTTEINDGRQSFGILNTLSFIQEGRQGKTIDEDLERRTLSQLTAIEALLEYCNAHAADIIDLVSAERSRLPGMRGTGFALRMEHRNAGGTLRIPVVRLEDGRDTIMAVGPYHDVVRPVCSTTVPVGYCIPAAQRSILDLLEGHHVALETVQTEQSIQAETWWIDSVGADVLEEDSLPRPFVRKTTEVVTLHPGDVLVSTAQSHGLFLPTLLEPESMWGVTKYAQFADLIKSRRYPIYRIP